MRILLIICFYLCCATSIAQLPQVASGSIIRWENLGNETIGTRNVDIWLPEGYSPKKKYSVLYMHDGQMLFDSTHTWNKQEWMVDETMGRLIREGKIRQTIVVGIWNRGEFRSQDYFPEKALANMDTALRRALIVKDLQGKALADEYLRFIVYTLKPKIDSAFPTRSERSNTFIAGSSMGGLISLYAYCEYPTVFGGAACISTHWPGSRAVQDPAIARAIIMYVKDNIPPPTRRKMYFDHGDQGLDSRYGEWQVLVDQIFVAKGYKGKRWNTKIYPGTDHNERAWQQRFDEIVIALMGRKGK
jgi:hypothetical protein